MIKKIIESEKLRFLVVGGVNTVFGFSCFSLIQYLIGEQIGVIAVVLLAHVCSSAVAFLLHRKITFRVSGKVVRDYFRFQTVYLVPISINLVLLPYLTHVVGINVYLAQAMITLINVVISYLGHKYFSFHRKSISSPE